METPKNLVSIVIPIYNMGISLSQSISSVLNQDYPNIEIILVDDGSTDNSLEIANGFAKKDSRINVIHTENRGSGPARNSGIDHATGKYIYFPDADDSIETDAISILVNSIEQTPHCDLLVFGYKNLNSKNKIISVKKYPDIVYDSKTLRNSYSECMTTVRSLSIQGAPWNKFFNLELIKENNIRFPSLRRHQDEGFICRYMCHSKRVRFISKVLYTYKMNDIQKTWSKYPIDYIEAVVGLYKIRQDTILKWNKEDILTHELVRKEYICFVIKALELAFSPKVKKEGIPKLKYINYCIDKSDISHITMPKILGKYQRIAMRLLKVAPILILPLFWAKTNAEKLGILCH